MKIPYDCPNCDSPGIQLGWWTPNDGKCLQCRFYLRTWPLRDVYQGPLVLVDLDALSDPLPKPRWR